MNRIKGAERSLWGLLALILLEACSGSAGSVGGILIRERPKHWASCMPFLVKKMVDDANAQEKRFVLNGAILNQESARLEDEKGERWARGSALSAKDQARFERLKLQAIALNPTSPAAGAQIREIPMPDTGANGWVDWRMRILIGGFAGDDLLFAMAHELAHLALNHPRRVAEEARKRIKLFPGYESMEASERQVIEIIHNHAPLRDQMAPWRETLEREADILAAWMLREGGFGDWAGISFFDRRMREPASLSQNHKSAKERQAEIEKALGAQCGR